MQLDACVYAQVVHQTTNSTPGSKNVTVHGCGWEILEEVFKHIIKQSMTDQPMCPGGIIGCMCSHVARNFSPQKQCINTLITNVMCARDQLASVYQLFKDSTSRPGHMG